MSFEGGCCFQQDETKRKLLFNLLAAVDRVVVATWSAILVSWFSSRRSFVVWSIDLHKQTVKDKDGLRIVTAFLSVYWVHVGSVTFRRQTEAFFFGSSVGVFRVTGFRVGTKKNWIGSVRFLVFFQPSGSSHVFWIFQAGRRGRRGKRPVCVGSCCCFFARRTYKRWNVLSGNPCDDPTKPFPCKSTSTCIPMTYVCDDNMDCEDGYDENIALCTAGEWPPSTTSGFVILARRRSLLSFYFFRWLWVSSSFRGRCPTSLNFWWSCRTQLPADPRSQSEIPPEPKSITCASLQSVFVSRLQ